MAFLNLFPFQFLTRYEYRIQILFFCFLTSHLAFKSLLTMSLRTILFLTVLSKVFMSESSIILSFLYQWTEGSGSPGQEISISQCMGWRRWYFRCRICWDWIQSKLVAECEVCRLGGSILFWFILESSISEGLESVHWSVMSHLGKTSKS